MSVVCAVTYLRGSARRRQAPQCAMCRAGRAVISIRDLRVRSLRRYSSFVGDGREQAACFPAAAVRPSVTICDLRAHCRSISIASVWFEHRLRAFFINDAIYRRSDSNDCSALRHRRTSNCRPLSKRDSGHIKNFATDRNDGRLCPFKTSTKITYDCYKPLYGWFNVIRFTRQLHWSECESWWRCRAVLYGSQLLDKTTPVYTPIRNAHICNI